MFYPRETGRTRNHNSPEVSHGPFHCWYHHICGIRPVERELQNTAVWLSCEFHRPLSGETVGCFHTEIFNIGYDLFDDLVELAACRGLFDFTYCID